MDKEKQLPAILEAKFYKLPETLGPVEHLKMLMKGLEIGTMWVGYDKKIYMWDGTTRVCLSEIQDNIRPEEDK